MKSRAPNGEGFLYLSRAFVAQALTSVNVISLVRDALTLHGRREVVLPREAYLRWKNGSGEPLRCLGMPCYIGGHIDQSGIKVINSNPANVSRGIPRAAGVTLLFDAQSAQIRCIMEGALISATRTAAVSVLCSELFGKRDTSSLAIVGAGPLAHAHLRLFLERFPQLDDVRIFDLVPGRARALIDEFSSDSSVWSSKLRVSGTPEDAIRGAHIIVPATTTSTDYIRADWIARGSVIVNVSLDDVEPEAFLRADQVWVDDWQLVADDPYRVLGKMYREGNILAPGFCASGPGCPRAVHGEIGELLAGSKRGRSHDEEIILVNPFGMAIEDIAVASAVFEIAANHELGIWLQK